MIQKQNTSMSSSALTLKHTFFCATLFAVLVNAESINDDKHNTHRPADILQEHILYVLLNIVWLHNESGIELFMPV